MFKIEKEVVKDITSLILINILIHGIMVFVTGYWWDDYKYAIVENMRTWKEHYMQAGRPMAYYMISSIHWLPIWAFRTLVFSLYSAVSVLIYAVLKKMKMSHKMALDVSILFVAVPINDARIMICVYPYALALFLFWLATYLLISMLTMTNKKKENLLRILSLIFFFVSFSNASLLFFYVVPIACVWCFEIVNLIKEKKLNVRMFFLKAIKYVDYYCIPFVFFVGKKVFFTPYGSYEGYNSITVSKLLMAIENIFKTAGKQLVIILQKREGINYKTVGICIVLSMLICIFIKKFSYCYKKENEKTKKMYIIGLFVGYIVFLIGLFPYSVVRYGRTVETTAVGGRDSMLLGLGVAIMCYCVFEIISFSKNMLNFFICIYVLFGCMHFGSWYLTYQEDYYEEISLQQYWLETEEIEQGINFVHIDRNDRKTIEGLRYYSLNHMACETFGKQSRWFARGVNDLELFVDGKKRKLFETYKEIEMLEYYDFGNYTINGIEEYKFDANYMEIIFLKTIEIFDYETFLKEVIKYGEYIYTPITKEESKMILEAYANDEMNEDEEIYKFVKSKN